MSDTVLTHADNGKALSVATGDTLVISLPENPTTGYRWQLDSLDSRLMIVAGDTYSPNPETQIGGGGTRALTLSALAAGRVSVSMKLRREWEPADRFADRYSVSVEIHP